MTWLNILTEYIIPIIYNSMMSLTLVLFFLSIFRIKDSSIRILFLFLPLIKPFIIVLEKVDVNEQILIDNTWTMGIRVPDPMNFIQKFHSIRTELINFSGLNNFILITVLSSIGFILIVRWAHLAFFYRSLACEEKVGKKEIPDIYSIIEKYTFKLKVRIPDVSLTHKNFFSPFIVGIKNTTLVLSPHLLERLNNEEKETLIKHELSHIKRKDNLINWIAIILRDLNFFNPFAYLSYYLIRAEQEKASDKLMVKYSEKSPKKIARATLTSILKINDLYSNCNFRGRKTNPLYISSFSLKENLNLKRTKRRVKNILNLNIEKIHSRLFPKVLLYLLFLMLLLIQITLVLNINDTLMFLR